MIGRLQAKGCTGTNDAAVSGSLTIRATASPYSLAAIWLASMSKKMSLQFSAPNTPFSLTARNCSSRDADFSGGLPSISSSTEKALSRAYLWITSLHLVQLAGLEAAYPPRQGVRRRALKYREPQSFPGHNRYELNTARASADDADPFSGQI